MSWSPIMWWARHCHFWINQELTLRRDDATFDVIPSGCKFRAWDIPQFTYLIRRGSITAQLTCHGLKLSTVPTTQSKLIQSAYSLDKPSTVCGTSACAMSSSRNRSRDCHTWTSHSTSGFDNELEADRSFCNSQSETSMNFFMNNIFLRFSILKSCRLFKWHINETLLSKG